MTAPISRRGFLHVAGSACAIATTPASKRALTPAHGPVIHGMRARPAASFVDTIGVNISLPYYDTPYGDYEGLLKPRLRESGIRYVRDGVPTPDQTDIVNKLRDLATVGIRSDLLAGPPGLQPADAVAMLKTVRHSVVSAEGPNEPDNVPFSYGGYTVSPGEGDFRAAVAYQRDFYAAIKADPATAALPVLVFSRGDPFIYNAEIGDISAYLDYGNMHSYSGGQEPTGSTNSLADYIQVERIMCGTKPLMATETGYFTAPASTDSWQSGISERAQGKYVARLYLEYFNAEVARTFVYEFIDEGPDALKSEQNYGMLRNDGTAKPAFIAVKNLIRLLRDRDSRHQPGSLRYTTDPSSANLHQTLLQKRNGEFWLILWLAVSSYDTAAKTDLETSAPVRVTFQEPMHQVATYLPLDSATPVSRRRHVRSIDVQVPDHPLLLQLRR